MSEALKRFVEREVEAIFDKDWLVIKLDEHRYYKRLSGKGVRAVDFLAVHSEFGLVMIEMKNYLKGKTSIPSDIDLVMLNKKKDTLRLISIINMYFKRQWYFRLITFIGIERLYPKDWLIWIYAKKHMDRGNYFFLGVVDY